MCPDRIPAEIFSVGEFLQDELNARKWSHCDLAARTGLSPGEITGISHGTRIMLAKDAEAIGRAFGTSAELWLRLQRAGRKGGDA